MNMFMFGWKTMEDRGQSAPISIQARGAAALNQFDYTDGSE